MTPLERIWPYALFAAAAVAAVMTIRAMRRDVITDEDGEIFHRRDHPISFRLGELFGVLSVGMLIYLGIAAMKGWR